MGILHNPKKTGCFPIRDRIHLIEKACADIPGIRVAAFDGLLVDFAKQEGASVVIRGLRAVSDFESEFQMAQVNHHIQPDVETLFMMTQPQFAYISSSIVRELAHFGGDYQSFIPPAIQEDVEKLFQQN